ncbi:sulfurtransferase [Sphingomonas sp. BIUV-7]|uniref:Sulfurtransferase n=1 Tax=Sphingomonas natans TaxID=3063330 RepID=A0ABT8Y650_9SPHN|nr:sulfurtransferase [Sphingomonas sp. BIUV-7]MDO6413793.1 sulfurtransferase [Sphingomonas sp. BIUV-7]
MKILMTPADLTADTGATILDATYYALEPGRDARADFESGHVPGALFLDLGELHDHASALPSMAPPAQQFQARLRALGIDSDDRVVLYDQAPHKTAARAWWLFRLFGFEHVSLLDGGLARWKAEGRPLETGPAGEPGGGHATAWHNPALVRGLEEMEALVAIGAAQIVDARSAARFSGEEGDPRPGVARGHMPGAYNLPYGKLFDAEGNWRSADEILAAFRAVGVDPDAPIVTTCGSGITASILLFGLALAGKSEWALYDGSWSEWGALPQTPKESVT